MSALPGAHTRLLTLPGGVVEAALGGDGPPTVVLVNGSGGPLVS